jgi:hypothetical protein
MLSELILSALTSVLFIAGSTPLINAQSSSAPPGWTASITGPVAIYKPDNLPSGKTFQLTIRPPQSLAGQPLVAWFTAQVQADLQQSGAQARIGNPQTNPDGSLLLLVPYQDHAGQNWTAVYAADTRSSLIARMGRCNDCSLSIPSPVSLRFSSPTLPSAWSRPTLERIRASSVHGGKMVKKHSARHKS